MSQADFNRGFLADVGPIHSHVGDKSRRQTAVLVCIGHSSGHFCEARLDM